MHSFNKDWQAGKMVELRFFLILECTHTELFNDTKRYLLHSISEHNSWFGGHTARPIGQTQVILFYGWKWAIYNNYYWINCQRQIPNQVWDKSFSPPPIVNVIFWCVKDFIRRPSIFIVKTNISGEVHFGRLFLQLNKKHFQALYS